jgi:hypothetical protein
VADWARGALRAGAAARRGQWPGHCGAVEVVLVRPGRRQGGLVGMACPYIAVWADLVARRRGGQSGGRSVAEGQSPGGERSTGLKRCVPQTTGGSSQWTARATTSRGATGPGLAAAP